MAHPVTELIGADGYLNLKKFFKHPLVKQVVNINLNLPISVLRPDSDPATWMSKNNSQKTVRVMQLANMDIDPEEIFVYDKNAETANEEQDDDEEEEPETIDNT